MPTKDISREIPARPLEIVNLRLTNVFPSPLNPRKSFDPAALQEMADDIKVDGVLQAITVRPRLASSSAEAEYEIVMGERRFRASCLAGLDTIPAVIRILDDKTLTRVALKENMQRSDLNPIEIARAYKACLDTGSTQADLGEDVGVSQSRIANMIRLLELPDDVQQMIEDGKLMTGHGIQLARYKDFPDLCRSVALETARREMPVKSLERALVNTHDWKVIPDARGQSTGARLAVFLGGYPQPKFDWKAVCPQCPFKAFRQETPDTAFCLRPAHYEELNRAAEAEAKQKQEKEADRVREKAISQARDAETRLREATTKAGRIEAEADRQQANAAKKAVEKGLPKIDDTRIVAITSTSPAECLAGSCRCCIQAAEYHGDRIVPACCDPKRKEALELAAKKDANKERRTILDDSHRQLSLVSWNRDLGETRSRRALALVAWNFLRNCKKDARKQVAAHLPEQYADIRQMLERTGYEIKDADAHAALARMDTTELLCLTAEIFLRDELISRYDYGHADAPNTIWFLSPVEAKPAPDEEPSPFLSSPLHSCSDCKAKDAGAFYVDANGYEVDKAAVLGDWVCDLCQAQRQSASHSEQLLCDQCGEPLTDGAFDEAKPRDWFQGEAARMTSGELAVRGQVYCEQCGPTRRDDGSPKNDGSKNDGSPELVPVDDWEYAQPPSLETKSLDDNFCRSCGVIPLQGNARLCGHCDPLVRDLDSVRDREEATHA